MNRRFFIYCNLAIDAKMVALELFSVIVNAAIVSNLFHFRQLYEEINVCRLLIDILFSEKRSKTRVKRAKKYYGDNVFSIFAMFVSKKNSRGTSSIRVIAPRGSARYHKQR